MVHLIGSLKKYFEGRHFQHGDEIKSDVHRCVDAQTPYFFCTEFKRDKCSLLLILPDIYIDVINVNVIHPQKLHIQKHIWHVNF
jgi:hypothetical protein